MSLIGKRLWAAIFFFLAAALTGCASRPEAPLSVKGPAVISKTGPITETDLGVPLYPRATPVQNKSFIYQNKSKTSAATASVSLTTSDSVDQVEGFYREKLGKVGKFSRYKTAAGELVDITVAKGKRQIRIQAVPLSKGTGSVLVILSQTKP